LRGDEAFQIGPLLLIDFKGTVATLPFVVDHNGSDGEAALVECGQPFFVICLCG
jgi:hypothetical protein